MCTSLSQKYYIVYLNNLTTCLDKVRLVHIFMCYNVSLAAKYEFNPLDAVVNNCAQQIKILNNSSG